MPSSTKPIAADPARAPLPPLALLLAALAGPAGAAAPAAGILIDNQGSQSVYNLYAAREGEHGWGADRLDDATVPRGRSRAVAIAHRPGRCLYRLKLVLADGSARVRRRVDICRGGRWTVDDAAESFAPAPR